MPQTQDHKASVQRHQLSTANMYVQFGSATIQLSAVVRELSMKHHVAKVAAVCFYHLRRLRHTPTHRHWSYNSASLACCNI